MVGGIGQIGKFNVTIVGHQKEEIQRKYKKKFWNASSRRIQKSIKTYETS